MFKNAACRLGLYNICILQSFTYYCLLRFSPLRLDVRGGPRSECKLICRLHHGRTLNSGLHKYQILTAFTNSFPQWGNLRRV